MVTQKHRWDQRDKVFHNTYIMDIRLSTYISLSKVEKKVVLMSCTGANANCANPSHQRVIKMTQLHCWNETSSSLGLYYSTTITRNPVPNQQ
jgi:hypothetical protein